MYRVFLNCVVTQTKTTRDRYKTEVEALGSPRFGRSFDWELSGLLGDLRPPPFHAAMLCSDQVAVSFLLIVVQEASLIMERSKKTFLEAHAALPLAPEFSELLIHSFYLS